MGSLLNLSGRALITPPPYNAEIEYLESDTGQYIDTGIIPTPETEVQFEYMLKNRVLTPIFGSGTYGDNNSEFASFMLFHYGSKTRDNYFAEYGRGFTLGTVLPMNIRICVSMNANHTTVTYNATEGTVSYSSVWDSEYAKNLFLFRGNVNYNYQNGKICLYHFIIKNGDILVRDYIPVRVGQIGYMYDKVSKQLFGNAGTGDFILGPDKTN